MAGTTLCVSCASLPLKDQSLAIKTTKCPDCKALVGLTSYGVPFRAQQAARKRLLSPMSITGLTIGAGLFVLILALAGFGLWSKEKVAGPDLGPAAPPPNELAHVPEVAVETPFPAKIQPQEGKRRINSLVQQIRNANAGGNKDAFVLANMDRRAELRGLPYVMGDACRLNMNRAQSFQSSVVAARDGMESDFRSSHTNANGHPAFWNTYFSETQNQGIDTDHGIAALAQILGPAPKTLRAELVTNIKRSNRPDANRVIARAAVFDSEGDIRMAAIKALKDTQKERSSEVTEVLMQGIRYPMAIVAKRSAQAIIMLDRKDLLPQLEEFMKEAAPTDPAETKVNGQVVHVVREVVKINHHRNCLLCHPPSQTGGEQEVPGVIPVPGSSFPTSPKDAYGDAKSSGDPMVRADTTYLRQDFSVMMPVENAAPWPEMQRFDFLVRSRPVEGKELAALQQKMQARGADFRSENHKAAQRVLTELGGQRPVLAIAPAKK